MTRIPRLRTAGRVVAIVVAAVVGAAALIALVAPLVIRGAAFGRLVEAGLPEMRGRIEIGGGRWSWGELISFLRGQTTPFALENVRVIDPEGTEVLLVARLSGILEREPGPPERLIVRNLAIEDATWKFVRMKREPRVGFLAAFDPKRPPRPGRAPRRPVTQISIVDANLAGVSAEFDLPTWGLVLTGVHGGASLSYGGPGQGPPAFSFAVHDCDIPSGGHLRILGRPRAFELPFQRGRLDWVGTTATAPDDIQIAASNVESGRSSLTLAGTFTGVYGRTVASKSPGIDLSARLADAADAAGDLTRAFRLGREAIRGDDASLALTFRGPFADLEIAAEGAGFDLRHPRFEALKLAFSLETQPLSGRLHVERLSFDSPAGGSVEVRGDFDRMQIAGKLAFSRFDAGPYLPGPIRPFAAGTLDGHLAAEIDLLAGRGTSDDVSLVLERPTGVTPRSLRVAVGKSPGRQAGGAALRLSRIEVDEGHVRLPRLSLGAFGGTLTAAGSIELWDRETRRWIAPLLDLTIRGRRISLARLAGPGFVTGAFSFSSQVRGTASDLTFEAALPSGQTVQFLGERFRLPARLSARVADQLVSFETLRMIGPGESEITVGGQVALAGQLALGLEIDKFPFDRLPGLGQTGLPLGGRLSGKLRLEGAPGAPSVSGRLAFSSVTFQGRAVGGGEVTIAPAPGGGVRARGNLTEAIGFDGVLAPRRGGLGGEAKLELRRLALDPFIPNLPGGLAASGLVSGQVIARVGPGQPAVAEGSLASVVLSVAGPARAGRRVPPPIELTSQGSIPIAARTGGGPIAIGPARFTSAAGTLELSGESERDDLRGRVRGRIQLGPFLAYLPTSIDRVSGEMEVDLGAERKGARGRLELRGQLAIATPLALRVKTPTVEIRVPSGRVDLASGLLETKALPFTVSADRVSLGPVRRLSASGRLTGRIPAATAAPATGKLRAEIDKLELDVPTIGPTPVRSDSRLAPGFIELRTRGAQAEIAALDLPLAGEARAVASSVAFVDRARFAVRLRGSPSAGLKLAGTVEIDAARAETGKKAPPSPPPPPAKSPRTPPAKPSPLQLAIQNLQLDLRVRSQGGAIHVAVPRIPDLRVDASFTVRGTPKRPIVTGGVQGANVYSAILLKLRSLFD